MIAREEANGEQILIGQTDHSRLAGQFAAHWGNVRFATPEPFESVPASYRDEDGEGVRISLQPIGNATIAIDPYPFDVAELRVQLCSRRMKVARFENRDAFVKAYFQAPLELMEWSLVDGAKVDGVRTAAPAKGI